MRYFIFVFVGMLALTIGQRANAQSIEEGLSYLEQDKYTSAGRVFKSLANGKASGENHFYLGYYYMNVDELDSARMQFEKGVAADSKNGLSHVGLGSLALKQGKKEEAKTHFEQAKSATKKKDKKAEVFHRIGEAYLMHEGNTDPAEAVANAQEALKLNPIVIVNTQAKFSDGQNANVFLVGSEAPTFAAGPDTAKIVAGNRTDLIQDHAVSADFFDAATFGGTTDVGTRFEINGKQAIIKVQTRGVRGLAVNFLYTTLDRAKFYGNFIPYSYSAITVKVKKGYTPEIVVKNINQHIFGVRAWQKEQIRQMTVNIVLGNTGIGVVFMLMVVFAVISGLFIIAISMYSTVIDRLKDYGTLKAIGATNRYVSRLILAQAVLYALMGYSLATVFLELFKIMVANAGILLVFHLHFRMALLMVTLLMAVLSSVLAIRRINNVEPAMVFRG